MFADAGAQIFMNIFAHAAGNLIPKRCSYVVLTKHAARLLCKYVYNHKIEYLVHDRNVFSV